MKNYLLFILFGILTSSQFNAQSLESNNKIVDSIYSNQLNEQKSFWVRLPENYNPSKAEKYPIVVVLDGFSLENSLNVVYENYW